MACSQLAEPGAKVAGTAECGDASRSGSEPLPYDAEMVDWWLSETSAVVAGLHEFAPSTCTVAADAAAMLFVGGIAVRLADGLPVLWAANRRNLYAPDLARAGLTPDRVVPIQVRDEAELIDVMGEALAKGSFGAVAGEAFRVANFASRRLQAAAAAASTPALLLRWPRRRWSCPLDERSGAMTRWRIGYSRKQAERALCEVRSVHAVGRESLSSTVPYSAQ